MEDFHLIDSFYQFNDWKIIEAKSNFKRNLSYTDASLLWNQLWKYSNPNDVLHFLINIRENLFNGTGERLQYYNGIKWFMNTHPNYFLENYKCIFTVGYWKDLLEIWGYTNNELLHSFILYKFCSGIKNDYITGIPTLCSKWAPTEGCSNDKKWGIVNLFCEQLGWSRKQYRQRLSFLRNKLNVTERLVCDQRWNEINFDTIPLNCIKKHNNTFIKYCKDRYINWLLAKPHYFSTKISGIEIMNLVRQKRVSADYLWNNFINSITIKNNCICTFDDSFFTSDYLYNKKRYGPIDVGLAMNFIINNDSIMYNGVNKIIGETIDEKIEYIQKLNYNNNTIKNLHLFNRLFIFSQDCIPNKKYFNLNIPTFYINLKNNKSSINLDYYNKGIIIINGITDNLFEHFINCNDFL